MSFVAPNSAVTGAASTIGATQPSATSGSSTATGLNQLDNSQTFLNLLVAQLKNQDPSNPANPTSFMTEIAQLTAVQSQTSLNAEEQTVAADSMLGQKISGTGSGGTVVSGTVNAVLLSASGPPQLTLAGQSGTVALDQITQVYATSTGSTSTGSTSTGSTSTAATGSSSSTASTAPSSSVTAAAGASGSSTAPTTPSSAAPGSSASSAASSSYSAGAAQPAA